jgi:acetyl-CoA carboxylase carboxyl transferase subunit alpha
MLKSALDFEKPIAELDAQIEAIHNHMTSEGLREWCREHGRAYDAETAKLEEGIERLRHDRARLMEDIFSKLSPWEKTQVARHKDRPHTADVIRLVVQDFLELHGDRGFADDPAIIGGMGRIGEHEVLVMGHEKGRDLKDKVRRNYGSAKPEGYRKAVRLMKLAERASRPVVSIIDTSAADSSVGAEERGISEAIAKAMEEATVLRVPIVVMVLGEGGSGGAIGIGIGDVILMMEHAVYSVIPPEGCANILWRDAARADEAAGALKLTAQDALRLGVIDEILPEPLGGAHRGPDATAITIREALIRALDELKAIPPDALVDRRYEKFRAMGQWTELCPAPMDDVPAAMAPAAL